MHVLRIQKLATTGILQGKHCEVDYKFCSRANQNTLLDLMMSRTSYSHKKNVVWKPAYEPVLEIYLVDTRQGKA